MATATREYTTWVSIKTRCSSSKGLYADLYFGRGLKVCAGWSESFAAFFADMGERPSPEHSIDRIDNDGNYSCGHCAECREHGWPMNCRWATRSQQANNTRRNVRYSFEGLNLTVAEWMRLLGTDPILFRIRLQKGWSFVRAATTARKLKIRTLTARGQTRSAKEWAAIQNIPAGQIGKRLRCGWTVDEALFTPVGGRVIPIQAGSANRASKYTDTQIREVCRLLAAGQTPPQVSRMCAVTYGTIKAIKQRKRWTQLSREYSF